MRDGNITALADCTIKIKEDLDVDRGALFFDQTKIKNKKIYNTLCDYEYIAGIRAMKHPSPYINQKKNIPDDWESPQLCNSLKLVENIS